MSERTYLTTTYAEKDRVKQLGALWDGATKRWYVPPGLDLASFGAWIETRAASSLPVQPSGEAAHGALPDTTEKGGSLSSLVNRIRKVIQESFTEATWVRAEISELKHHAAGHVFLTLVEHDEHGKEIAKVNATLWAGKARKLIEQFCEATNSDFAAGIKILVRARVVFNPRGAISLDIDAIDPSFTLGELEAKLRRIRRDLAKEGIAERNRNLDLPYDYLRVAVVSPEDAAGLGDFKAEASRLQAVDLCRFRYFTAVFQGEKASASVSAAIRAAGDSRAQVVVIIRGGGAVADLHWLSDMECARAVCLCPLPVITGIGHEKDKTILDEVANRSFGTPSKVVGYIETVIREVADTAAADFHYTLVEAGRAIDLASANCTRAYTAVESAVEQALISSKGAVDALIARVTNYAEHAVPEAEAAAEQHYRTIRASTQHWVAQAEIQVHGCRATIEMQATKAIESEDRAIVLARNVTIHEAGRMIDAATTQVEDSLATICTEAIRAVDQTEKEVDSQMRSIIGMGPEQTLRRGFAMAWNGNAPVSSRAVANRCNTLRLQFHDGTLNVQPVKEVS